MKRNTKLWEQLSETVSQRLQTIGYTVKNEDDFLLKYSISKSENYIKNFCNIDIIPDELFYVEVDIICGNFLKEKKSVGQLDGFEFNGEVKSISEGDTSIIYAGVESVSEQVDKLIKNFLDKGDELICFRKIKWS